MNNKLHVQTKTMAQSVSRRAASMRFRIWLTGLAVAATPLVVLPTYAFTATGALATPRDGFTSTLLPNGKVLVAGGYDGTNQLSTAELYDPATGRWMATEAMRSRRSIHSATLLPNGKVLVAGGYNGANRVASAELYDPATGTWTLTGPLNAPHANHSATLLRDGTVLIAGGADDSSPIAGAEIYNPATEIWAATGSMAGSRASHTATLLSNGQVLVAGGDGTAGSFSAELYDPATRTWVVTGELSAPRSEHTATLLPNGRVLIVGGRWYDPFLGDQSLGAVEQYDPGTGTWTDTGPLTESRFGHTASLLPNGQVLVAGGRHEQGFFGRDLASAELYEPASGTWAPAGDMTVARLYHSATLLPSGRVLVAAGFNYASNDLPSAEVYDPTANPATGNWANTGWMADARAWHAATLLTNGQVLVAGGCAGAEVLPSAEIYDPVSETWAQTGPLNIPRNGHTAVLLPSGKVLVVGGTHFPNNAELYDPNLGSWSLVLGPPDFGGGLTATLLCSGKVLVAGGITTNGTALPAARLYDPVAGTWTTTGAMTKARRGCTATLLPNGQVLVAGGYDNGGGGAFSGAELYDPVSGRWTGTGTMNASHSEHTATLLADGRVLVAGGSVGGGGTGGPISTAELYDPATGTWSLTAYMGTARFSHTATLLPDGCVLVAGGEVLGAPWTTTTAELYDPASGTWTTIQPMNDARNMHTSTLLPDGHVLVVGGFQTAPIYHASAELYDVGLSFDPSWQPQVRTLTSTVSLGSNLAISGTGFRGISESSGGNGCQNSGSDFPLVQLRSVESGQTVFLLPTNWSATSFDSVPLSGFPPGSVLVTVFVNGVPSLSSLLDIAISPTPIVPLLTGPSMLPDGSFQFSFSNTPGAVFSVLTATNLALPAANWTFLGSATEIAAGQFQFTDKQASNHARRFYRTRSP